MHNCGAQVARCKKSLRGMEEDESCARARGALPEAPHAQSNRANGARVNTQLSHDPTLLQTPESPHYDSSSGGLCAMATKVKPRKASLGADESRSVWHLIVAADGVTSRE